MNFQQIGEYTQVIFRSFVSNYNPKNGKGKAIFYISTTSLIILLGAGIVLQNHQRTQTIKNVKQANQFSSTGSFSPKAQQKLYKKTQHEANQALQKYGKNSSQYNKLSNKLGQMGSASFQVTTPSNPGKEVLTGISKVINDYGKVSNAKLEQEAQNNFYLSSGELQWVYEHKLLDLMNVKNGSLGFDMYQATLYAGFTFNSQAERNKFEKIATLMYDNSDVKPMTKKLTFVYLNSNNGGN